MLLVVCAAACHEERPSPVVPQPPSQPVAPSPASPTPDVGPTRPAVDLTTVRQATVTVTKVVDPGGPPCGVLHSVAAVEVDVLGVRPPSALALYVSCPADLRPRDMLQVGRTLDVTLHAKRQSWPKPAHRHGSDLPVRYVKRLAPAAD